MSTSITITMILLAIMFSSLIIGIYNDFKKVIREKEEIEKAYSNMNKFNYSYESMK